MFTAWLVTLQFMRRTEVITWSDALRALLAVEAFTLAIWSFSAMAGLLGRYRYVAWMALGLFYFFLSQASVAAAESPLLKLLSESIAMARAPVPTQSLLEALVVIVVAVTATCVLGLGGSGAMAATLAKRMTGRERAFVIAATVVALSVAVKLKKDRALPPFELAAATRSTSGKGVVGVMKTPEVSDEQASALGEAVAHDVDSLADALQLEKRPSIFLLPQRGLEPTTTQRASLTGAQGIVLRAAPDIEPSALRARVLHELISDATDSRALKEDRHALLDGFSVWWTVQDDAELRERWWRRAGAARVSVSRDSMARWGETTERVGDCLGNALAFSLVDTLVAKVGREKALTLATKLFAPPRTGVLATWLEDKPATLLKEAGVDWDSLTAETEARRLTFQSGAMGAAQVTLDGDLVKVHVTGVERWRVLYGKLGPWSRGQTLLPRLDVKGADATLPQALSRGERLVVLVDHDDAALGCPVRLEALRLEAP